MRIILFRYAYYLCQRKGQKSDSEDSISWIYIKQGSESGCVPMLPTPPHSFPLSFALSGSSGQISPTLMDAGLCGCVFMLEPGLPSGSLHLSKHPPGRCSVFPVSHAPLLSPLSVSPLALLEFLGLSSLNQEKDSERRKENSFTWTHSTEPLSISCSIPLFLNGEFL